ncbi:MAG: KH domain-containing protein [Methanofollis sp.]|nr:KH domain-containing protein [Methanofollis sp.]
MTIQEIRIGERRIGALIGKGGATKRKIEEKTGSTIKIDSEEGDVLIEGEDAFGVLRAADVVTAIARGFSPERAFVLFEDEDMAIEIIDLSEIDPSLKQQERLKGRIIGKAGKGRQQIENMTKVEISVQGKTVTLIGMPEKLRTARAAIEMLINGAQHETVFSFLEKKRREEREDMLGYYY